MAKKAIPARDILINFSRPCDDAAKEADSLLRCRRLDGRRPNGSGIALYLYVSRDTTPLIEANILETDMAMEHCTTMQQMIYKQKGELQQYANRIWARSIGAQ